jgi:lipopolysaccharide/colanic/teichoic acid biosynthesis glycosyltransferase
MNRDPFQERIMARILAAQTSSGRFRLMYYVRAKCLIWRVVVQSTLFLKRTLDIVISCFALVALAPVFGFIALLVKLDGGPVFFRQIRIGLLGREFRMLKFRSMIVNADAKWKDVLPNNEKAQGVTVLIRNDPRITRVGSFLRKSSLDELPQFLNVLLGDMSLVGPRPPLPREVAKYTQADRRRLLVKPGITCLWQIGEREGGLLEVGHRHSIEFPEQVELDVRYIESHSLRKDLWILLKTIPAILFGRLRNP